MAAKAATVRPRAFPITPRLILFTAVVVLLAFAVIYPFILMVVNSFAITNPPRPVEYGLSSWRFALSDPSMLDALKNTAYVAIVRHGIGFPAAIVIAWLIARTDMPGGRWLEFLFWVAFFLPVIPVTQAWIMLAHPTAGLLNQLMAKLAFVDKGFLNIYSFWGIIWVHLFTGTIAILVMLLTPVFRNMDASLEDASRISGAGSIRTLFRVTVPVMTPALATLTVLAIMRAFQTVEIELILGIPFGFYVFGSKIFDMTRQEPPVYGAATALGVIVLLMMIPLIIGHRWATQRRQFTTLSGKYDAGVVRLRKWRKPAFAIVFTLTMMMTVLPALFLLMQSFMKFSGYFFGVDGGPWSLRHWEAILGNPTFLRSVRNTVMLALGSATITMAMTALLAYIIVRTRTRLRGVIDFLTWVPFVFPGIILALAWLWIILQSPFLRPIYGSIWALILVSGLSGLTLGVQIIKSNLLQMGSELEEASFITGAGFSRTVLIVVLPLLAPTMVVVWVLNFVNAAGSAIIPAMLATAQSKPLALLQLEFVLRGEGEKASIVGILVIFLTIGVAIAARALGFRVGLGRGAV